MDQEKQVGSAPLNARYRSGGGCGLLWTARPLSLSVGDKQSEAKYSDSGWKDSVFYRHSLRSESLCSHLELSHQQQLGCHQFATGCVAMKSKAER